MKKNIYVYKSGELKRIDNSLAIETKEGPIYIPIVQCDKIFIFSTVSINTNCLRLISLNNICVLFFDYYGNYFGKYVPKEEMNGALLVNQVNMFNNNRDEVANILFKGGFENMLSLIKYYNKKLDLLDVLDEYEYYLCKFDSYNTIQEKMLVEARLKHIYYSMFERVLTNERYHFNKRSLHPPLNEVNAMLSFGYALLYGEIEASLSRSKLFPSISFIHSLEEDSTSLKYDLADILKPVIIDRLVLRLVRKKQIKDEYFEWKNNGCYLSKEGKVFFTNCYDSLLQSTIQYHNRMYTYKRVISMEVHNFSNYIHVKKEYKPFKMKW